MKKKTKSVLYMVCIAMIICAALWWLQSRPVEGFQDSQWPGPPYISGAAFKALCKYNLDDRYELIPYDDEIEEGDRVFLKIIDIPGFLAAPPPVKVTLVISNSDEALTTEMYEQMKPYVTEVFAISSSVRGVHQIPIGFRDDAYTPHKDLTDILNDPEKSGEKQILCLVNFLVETNGGERQRALERFLGESWATVDKSYLNYGLQKATVFTIPETIQKRLDYYATLKQSKFVVCPPGRGLDTHRVYETLFFGGIPIIKTSFLDPMYKKLGGCWIVQDWSEVTEETCAERWASRVEPILTVDVSQWLNLTYK
jgi:hypothetical protein